MSHLTDTKPLLPKARAIVVKHQRGSTSLVQRHLQIGYNAASELLEMLEADGVVGRIGSDGDYGRKVLLLGEVKIEDMPQTPAERQEARRKRLLIGEGRAEVRGIFLPPALHAELKAYAAKLLKGWAAVHDAKASKGNE